jgi:hypothetical protein
MAKLTVKALKISPSLIYALVAPADNAYVAGGVQLNLAPGALSDPSLLGVEGPSTVGPVLPGVFAESMGGYYAQLNPPNVAFGVGLAGYSLQYFQPNGTELAAGAYPAAITNGTVVIAIPVTA